MSQSLRCCLLWSLDQGIRHLLLRSYVQPVGYVALSGDKCGKDSESTISLKISNAEIKFRSDKKALINAI
ncbi:hypothetical protein Ahy_A09g041881 isoform B [Arachis hypogaea]|uniref:Uncharacterized protein n=1 Tax=Arachis hypogaea TaxID=3818 RepID=A0A445BE84_ARAHY|nr:hypothetical protein Ahy_A09g041881 isoform B [Arachis hypogaea]